MAGKETPFTARDGVEIVPEYFRSDQLDRPFDAILCNPPFHTSRQADPALGVAFLTAAARCLSPGGTLWLVANRHLPYERALSESFAQVAEIGGTNGYKLFTAARPRTAKRPRN